ncbi:NAD-P-binding protein [Gigaspora rosea]|uniref:NAD-P-binding protein n=1 Tax=Gigaspora rosea TaxID=44941 RepID=A0A397TVU5_9GLOM|nr:NAD-P-binding protein [Gigaspora rosea]
MNTRAKTAGLIKEFFSSSNYAVVGASTDPSKYGNKVLKWYINSSYSVTPVNPKEKEIEGLSCVPNLSSLPNLDPNDTSVSIITQPSVSKDILTEASKLGISRIWLQPGAENVECQEYANKVGLQIISGGPCVLVNGIKR